jgi:hypothetical protein
MAVHACGIFYGGVRLRDCMGVQIAHCQVSCPVTVVGEHANGFVDNTITEGGFDFEFAEATLVRGNMTLTGEWRLNRLPRDTAGSIGLG